MSNKKKVALQLYGHLRTYKECYSSMKENLIDLYDCDVFIHSWDTLDHTTKAWHSLNEGKEVVNLEDAISKELERLYQPKNISIEKQDVKDLGMLSSNGQTYSIFGIKCILHSMNTVNELRESYQRENNIDYDFVICSRPDIFLNKAFDLDLFFTNLSCREIDEGIFVTGAQYSSLLNDIRYFGGKDLLHFGKPNVISSLLSGREKSFLSVQQLKSGDSELSILEYYFYNLLSHSNLRIHICDYLLDRDYEIRRLYSSTQAEKVEAEKLEKVEAEKLEKLEA